MNGKETHLRICSPSDFDTQPKITVACGASAAVTEAMVRAVVGGRLASTIVYGKVISELAKTEGDGCVVLSGDDLTARRMAAALSAQIIWVGRGADCDIAATNVRSGSGRLKFQVDQFEFDVPVWGRHHLVPALAAIAVGRLHGMSLEEVAEGLSEFRSPPTHCEVFPAVGATVIDDTSSHRPDGVRAALDLLREVPAQGRRIVVCGDFEGPDEEMTDAGQQLGEEIVTRSGADVLVMYGLQASTIRAGALAAGMAKNRLSACRTPDEVADHLRRTIRPGDAVLVQGSRQRGMGIVVDRLRTHELRAAA